MIVTDERVVSFAEGVLGSKFVPPFTCIGIERDDRVVAAAVFNHFEGFDIHLTAAGQFWTRGFLRAVGLYVFGQLGCIRMTAITEQQAVIDFAVRIGGQVEGVMRNHFGPNRNGVVIGFLKEEWRYGIAT